MAGQTNEIELCVFRNGKWEMFNIYPISKTDLAVQDAIELKTQNAFKKIAVIEEGSGKVHYFYSSDDRKLGFDQIKKALEISAKAPASSPKKTIPKASAPRPQIKKAGGTPSAPLIKKDEPINQSLSLAVLVIGFVFAVLIMFSMQFSIGSIIFAAAFAGTCAYYSHILKNPIVDEEELALQRKKVAESTQKHKTATLEDDPNYITPEDLEKAHQIFESIKTETMNSIFWNAENQKLEKDNHFGLILFSLGALQAIAMSKNKSVQPFYKALTLCFKPLHLDEGSILRVAENLGEFKLNMRYGAMFDRGFSSTQKHIQNTMNEIKAERALELWQQAEEAEEAETNAVLFTDIVNFTGQVAEKGEDWLRSIVHAHNRIVRDVLEQYQGKEIKHTGDGIMATFFSPLDALNASVNMQKGFEAFSKAKEDFAFGVRIGIASGTPVKMDGDVFGTPVNLAARVMSFGNEFEITLSKEAHDICIANEACSHVFTEETDLDIKGFDGSHSIFKVNWRDEPHSASPAKAALKQTQP